MFKKTVLTTVALGLVISGYSVISQAEGPIYDEQGELILDPVVEEQTNVAPTNVQVPPVQTPAVANTTVASPVATTTQAPAPKMEPASLTYLAGKGGNVLSVGTGQIANIKVQYDIGLAPGAWSKQGNNLVFNTAELDESGTGTYVFEVTFTDGTKRMVDIRVIGKQIPEVYWQQNLMTFNVNETSHQHKDLELVSNSTNLKVLSLTIDEVPVPTSKYMIVNGTVIVSKDYLKTLPVKERYRINLVYNNGGVLDFSLEISEEEVESNQQTPIDC